MSEASTTEYLRKFTRELPVDLNDGELQQYGRMLADKVVEEQVAEDAKKEEMARRSAALKVISQEIARLADARAKGKELRGVLCGERIHGNMIEIVRLDQGVVVDQRPASLQDLQVNMPIDMTVPEVDEGRDNVIPFSSVPMPEGEGEMVEASTGDAVYSGAPDDVDEATEAEYGAKQEPKTEFFVNPDAEPYSEAAAVATWEGDIPEDEEPAKEASVTESALDDDEIDRKLEEREQAKREDANAKSKSKTQPATKPTRERSKAANMKTAKATRKK